MARMNPGALAVHEAAHAIVAAHYRIPVYSVRIGHGRGETLRADVGRVDQQAAITAAGEVGQRLIGGRYVDLACDDLADFEQRFGLDRLWRAERDAESILTHHRDAFRALAVRLERERLIIYR